ncbi:MAG: hypothetical protein V1729_05610 [Candidatus Woesearchaeota archaeon]
MFGIHRQSEKEVTIVAIPSSIFQDRNLAPLESITEYLKEENDLSYHEIAQILDRDDRTIWTCYNRAQKKRQEHPKAREPSKKDVQIPLEIFKNRQLAPLESISFYLKERASMSFHEIAVLVGRDDRTIWTCHNRAKKKQARQGVVAG